MAVVRSLDEMRAERADLASQVSAIEAESAGERFNEEQRELWNQLNTQVDELDATIDEREKREKRIADIGSTETSVERGAHFNVPRGPKTEDIYDLSSVRREYNDPSVEGMELRDRAMRAIDGAHFPHPHADRQDVQTHIAGLVDDRDSDGAVARHILATGSPVYKRAFGKYLAQKPMSNEESRALSLTTSAGGFAVPFVLDPTIIPTSNLAVNPFRAIARVEQITVDEWRGVSSAGVTAAYAAEAAVTSDNAPTLAQPVVSTEKAQAFIPFSIEIGMDWGSLQAEMARLLQDAKDELEASKFAVGTGTNEPQGVLTGATATVTSSTGGSFFAADLYALEAQLGPRFRPRASVVMNRAVAQKIRQFDTAGGASIWIDNLQLGVSENQVPTPGQYSARVLGYGAYEASAMASVVTTGAKTIIFGDFSYYLIADRIGLSIEVIPHLFNSAGALTLPTGQRGLYAYWRNGAGVLSTNAFRTLQA